MESRVAAMKATLELEELYLGVKDSSVDLTFKDLANFQQEEQEQPLEKKVIAMEPIHEETEEDLKKSPRRISKSPSLDFAKALHEAKAQNQLHARLEAKNNKGFRVMNENSQVHHDVTGTVPLEEEQRGTKRQGIPHTNICVLCSVYIHFFRHRCLVCGRAYCRKCVVKGMGAMAEGRKCMDCLGKRFAQRYIQRAGRTGCCCRYPVSVKQQELKWAEKGPRQASDRQHGRNPVAMTPEMRPRSTMAPGTPSKFHA
ncbi:hypothetical protein J5N97_013873 [Dioscorea zingiberensis]|uniref:Uncharacterized protein n=1 Tax=Dioscorea zingiberensis TaxID=325984 RepID=A0A9D5CSV0_9LILI|nr:hypothetical protein J5N97_013873 [Dioscorea zingiberensis]